MWLLHRPDVTYQAGVAGNKLRHLLTVYCVSTDRWMFLLLGVVFFSIMTDGVWPFRPYVEPVYDFLFSHWSPLFLSLYLWSSCKHLGLSDTNSDASRSFHFLPQLPADSQLESVGNFRGRWSQKKKSVVFPSCCSWCWNCPENTWVITAHYKKKRLIF